MKTFLSIDWDFFVDLPAKERYRLFPREGDESMSESEQLDLWAECSPEVSHVKTNHILLSEMVYAIATNDLFYGYPRRVLLRESHKDIYQFIINNTDPEEIFRIINVDFHHDMYSFQRDGDPVNCSNWVMKLKEERPNLIYYWVPRVDSEYAFLGGEYSDNTLTLSKLKGARFDHIFMCRSPLWSPPSMDGDYLYFYEFLKYHVFKSEIPDGHPPLTPLDRRKFI